MRQRFGVFLIVVIFLNGCFFHDRTQTAHTIDILVDLEKIIMSMNAVNYILLLC